MIRNIETRIFDGKEYVIKHKVPKTCSPNINFIKERYSADIAFANEKMIYFGETLDIVGEETIYKDEPLSEVVKGVLDLYIGCSYNIDVNFIGLLIKNIQYHLPKTTEKEIIAEIKNYINTNK